MKLWPPLLHLVRRERGNVNAGVEDGIDEGGTTTKDGTLDFRGRPALKKTTGARTGARFVIVEQVMTSLAFFIISNNLIIYLTTVMHETNAKAAKNVVNWYGAGYVTPLIFAFISDSYTGRFVGTVMASVVELASLAMLTVAGSVKAFHPPQCPSENYTCRGPTKGQTAFLYTGLYIMDLGAGGVQGTVVAFGADQFDEEDDKEKKQESSYFTYVYQTLLIGSFISSTFFVYLQDNVSFGLSWGIAGVVMLVGTVVFVAGARLFRYHEPGGNPLTRVAQVAVACARKRRTKVSSADDLHEVHDTKSVIEGSRRIRHSNKFRFLDKAAIATEGDKDQGLLQNPWHVCTVTQVEEAKFVLRVLPVFLTTIMYTVCYSQIVTLFVQQGYTMDRQLGSFLIPPASLAVFECLSVFFWVAIYDRLLVPYLRRLTGNPRGMSELKRVGIGLLLSIASMTIAALVEIRRLRTARDHGLENDAETPVPMSVFWLVPQYFVIGASEVFTYVGMNEFFYDQAPDAVRSLGSSISVLANALGYFLATLVLTVVGRTTSRNGDSGWIADNLNNGRLDLFYWLLTVLSTLNFLAFLACSNWYEYMVTRGPIAGATDPGPQALQLSARKSDAEQIASG